MLRQLIHFVMVIWLAATLSFFLLRLLPGDAVETQLALGGASQGDIDRIRQAIGLDEPLLNQYGQYIANLSRGNMGYSLTSGLPVSEMIIARLMPTLTLGLLAALTAIAVGIGLGLWSGLRIPGYAVANLLTASALAMPIFWTGILAIAIFSVWLDLFPATGSGTMGQLVLPVGILAFHTAGPIARIVGAAIHETRDATFVLAARSRGLGRTYILWRYNLLVIVPTIVGVVVLQTGFLLSGAVITESLFVRPGLGKLLLQSVVNQDFPVVQGIVILSAGIYAMLTLVGDSVSRLVDPRLHA
ncbi:MAG: ABC transporter permease [Chloroflexota bacterium]